MLQAVRPRAHGHVKMLRQKEEEEKEAAAAAAEEEADQDRWMRKHLGVTFTRRKTSWHKPQVPVWGRRRRCAERGMLRVLQGTAIFVGYR